MRDSSQPTTPIRLAIHGRLSTMNASTTTRSHTPAVSGFFACGSLISRSGGPYLEATTMLTDNAGRRRAQRLYPIQQPCIRCGRPGERHHVDGDTFNNSAGNVQWLCRMCHMIADGRLEQLRRLGRKTIVVALAAMIKAKKSQTHCKRGHLLSGANLYMYHGRRNCRACVKLAKQRYESRQRKEQQVWT